MAITSQSGLREYTGNINDYSGMISGLTPDIHTLRSLNPETTLKRSSLKLTALTLRINSHVVILDYLLIC